MNEFLGQVYSYFEKVPLWPFVLLAVVCFIAIGIDVMNRKRRADAIDNFRYTIETELSGMYPKPINWPENVSIFLCERLPEMQENFENLRLFIPQKQLNLYNKDWNKYCDFCREVTDKKRAADNESNPKEVFHTLISTLLQYAKKPK